MKIKCYTLVEILMVVGIIAILVGLAIPVLNSARATARLNKAAAECNSIALAIKNFESEYGQMPNPTDISGNPSANDGSDKYTIGEYEDYSKKELKDIDADYKSFFTMMIGYKYVEPTKEAETATSSKKGYGYWNNNKKKIKFLDPTSDYANEKGFLDPWGKPYMITYKIDGDQANTFKLYKDNGAETVTLLTPIVVYTAEGIKRSKVSNANFKDTRFATSWRGVYTTPEK